MARSPNAQPTLCAPAAAAGTRALPGAAGRAAVAPPGVQANFQPVKAEESGPPRVVPLPPASAKGKALSASEGDSRGRAARLRGPVEAAEEGGRRVGFEVGPPPAGLHAAGAEGAFPAGGARKRRRPLYRQFEPIYNQVDGNWQEKSLSRPGGEEGVPDPGAGAEPVPSVYAQCAMLKTEEGAPQPAPAHSGGDSGVGARAGKVSEGGSAEGTPAESTPGRAVSGRGRPGRGGLGAPSRRTSAPPSWRRHPLPRPPKPVRIELSKEAAEAEMERDIRKARRSHIDALQAAILQFATAPEEPKKEPAGAAAAASAAAAAVGGAGLKGPSSRSPLPCRGTGSPRKKEDGECTGESVKSEGTSTVKTEEG